MSDQPSNIKFDFPKLAIDLIAIPVLSLWAFLSILPVGGIFTGDPATLRFWLNMFFLATGVWGGFCLFFGIKLLMRSDARASFKLPSRPILTAFALVWCTFYIVFFVSSR
jgi:hypothetical protein